MHKPALRLAPDQHRHNALRIITGSNTIDYDNNPFNTYLPKPIKAFYNFKTGQNIETKTTKIDDVFASLAVVDFWLLTKIPGDNFISKQRYP